MKPAPCASMPSCADGTALPDSPFALDRRHAGQLLSSARVRDAPIAFSSALPPCASDHDFRGAGRVLHGGGLAGQSTIHSHPSKRQSAPLTLLFQCAAEFSPRPVLHALRN